MDAERSRSEPKDGTWQPLFALAIASACAVSQLLPGPGGGPPMAADFRWITHANTVLAGAAAVYVAYYWLGVEKVGQAASLLAALGALGIPLGLLADAAQAMPTYATGARFGLYEGTALLSAACVFAYLLMERVYRNRTGALLIMPAVLLAVLCEMWLIAQGAAAPGRAPPPLSGYWVLGQKFSACLGYGALATAAARGAWVLVRGAGNPGAFWSQAEAIVGATAIGAPMLLIGTVMGVAWSLTDDGGDAPRGAAVAMLPALLAAVALLLWARWRSPNARRLAWYAVAAFALSATGLMIGAWPAEALG